jgi:hypothetical protein
MMSLSVVLEPVIRREGEDVRRRGKFEERRGERPTLLLDKNCSIIPV